MKITQKALKMARVALVVGATIGLSSQALAATKLRYSDLGPPKGWRAEAIIHWAEQVTKETGGEVEFEFHWSQSLLKAKATLQGVGSGLADAGTVFGIYSPAQMPLWNAANSPSATGDIWVATKTWQEMFKTNKALQAEADKNKIKVLAIFSTGAVDLLMRDEPVTDAKDIKNKKIRATGGWAGQLKNLGASTVAIGYGELYQALDKGVVDGTLSYIPSIKTYKLYEVGRHVTELGLGQVVGYGLGVNKKTFDGLSQKNRDIILKLSDDLQDDLAKRYYSSLEKTKAELAAGIDGKPVTFHQASPAQAAVWQAAGADYISNWKNKVKGTDADAFLADLARIQAKYEEARKNSPTPWLR